MGCQWTCALTAPCNPLGSLLSDSRECSDHHGEAAGPFSIPPPGISDGAGGCPGGADKALGTMVLASRVPKLEEPLEGDVLGWAEGGGVGVPQGKSCLSSKGRWGGRPRLADSKF